MTTGPTPGTLRYNDSFSRHTTLARSVQADREALIAQGVPPIAAQQRSPWRCGYGPHCGPVPRNPNDRDASCADVPEFLRPRRSLREYYRAMDSDAAVEW